MGEKEEKREPIKVRLTTVILLFIIMMLLMVIAGMYLNYRYRKDCLIVTEPNETNIVNTTAENNKITSDNSTISTSTTSGTETLDVNSEQVKTLYKYIPALDNESPESLNAYQDKKVTMENMNEKFLLAYAFTQLSLSSSDKLPYKSPDGTIEEPNEGWFGFKSEILQKKVKEIYGKNIKDQNFDYNIGKGCRYENGEYFHSTGGSLDETITNIRRIKRSYKDDKDNIYIEDSYLTLKENYEKNLYNLYSSSNCTKLVEKVDENLVSKLKIGNSENVLEEIANKYTSKMVGYKHTFKKNTDGSYYWYSTEPIEKTI